MPAECCCADALPLCADCREVIASCPCCAELIEPVAPAAEAA